MEFYVFSPAHGDAFFEVLPPPPPPPPHHGFAVGQVMNADYEHEQQHPQEEDQRNRNRPPPPPPPHGHQPPHPPPQHPEAREGEPHARHQGFEPHHRPLGVQDHPPHPYEWPPHGPPAHQPSHHHGPPPPPPPAHIHHGYNHHLPRQHHHPPPPFGANPPHHHYPHHHHPPPPPPPCSINGTGPIHPPPPGQIHMNPPVRLEHTDQAIEITMDLPGVKPEDLKVEVEQGTFFRISGKRTIGIKLPTEFSRRFALGDSANLHNMRANLSEGVLIITVPKRTNEAAPVVIQIGQAQAKSADDTSGDDNEQPNENETVAAGLKK